MRYVLGNQSEKVVLLHPELTDTRLILVTDLGGPHMLSHEAAALSR